MRIQLMKDKLAQKFSQQLLAIGDGNNNIHPDTKEESFEHDFCQMQISIEELMQKFFPKLLTNFRNNDWLFELVILALTKSIIKFK